MLNLETSGIVRDGVIVPDQPLPEGVRVTIQMTGPIPVPPELAEEFAALDEASERALRCFEELLEKEAHDAAG